MTSIQNTTNNSISMTEEAKKIEANAINESDNAKSKSFMSKKRLIFIIIFLVLTIGFVFITIFPILKINWNLFNQSVGVGFAQSWGLLWLFLILINAFINLNRCFITVLPRLNKMGCKIKYKDYIILAFTLSFFYCVTPAGLGGDPYMLFWLKTKGVSTFKATSILFSNSWLWQISQIVINLPFFIICCIYRDGLLASTEGTVIFILICVGLAIDFLGFIFIFLMNVSKNFHYFCSRLFNWFKKKFHMKYHTKDQIREKYKEKAVLKQDFVNSMKDWKTTLLILFLFIFGEFLGLLSMIWAMGFVQYGIVETTSSSITYAKVGFNWGWVLVCSRLSIPANKINLLPGQAMGYEAVLLKLLEVYSDLKVPVYVPLEQVEPMKKTMVSNAVLVGKLFYSWIPAIVGIGTFTSLTIKQNRLAKQGQLLQQKY